MYTLIINILTDMSHRQFIKYIKYTLTFDGLVKQFND